MIKSKRFLSLLSLICNNKCNMNINEDSLIEQLNIIENKLNAYDIKLPMFGLSGLNYIIYQNKKALTEPMWSKITMNTRLLVNLIHEFFYVFLTSYFNDFSCEQIFRTIKYNFWYDDNCCQLIFDENTWLLSTNNCLFTNDILTKLDNMSQTDEEFLRDLPNIQLSGIEYAVNTPPMYE
ncbi:unnamed protein product [Rotaria sp. Silwood2]|nr:unnamed protein product [Rotaria sp. Silwood2]